MSSFTGKDSSGDSTAATTPRTAYLWLVSRTDGSLPKVVRAVTARGAVLSRFEDDDDHIMWGNVAVWRLGNFPEQFEVTADTDGLLVRELGNLVSDRQASAAATPNLWVVVDPVTNNLLGEFDYHQQAEEFVAELDDPSLVIVETRDDA